MPEQVNILGVPITLVSEQDMADAPEGTVYIMTRIADTDPSHAWPELKRRRTKTICDQCRAVCWFDPKSYGRLPAYVERICIQCALGRIKSEKEKQ